MNKVLRYDNGLRVIVEQIPSMRSLTTGIWVGAGSSKETAETNGISHFIEHMMFKGTADKSPFDIANEFESMGAAVNAFTGKECTCYYVKSTDDSAEKCFALLTDIFFHSDFKAEELDKERKVIVEEINMVEDSPEDVCYDLIAETVYDGHALGQTILGPTSNVLRFGADDVRAYMGKLYSPDNIVVSMAGNISFDEADELIKKYMLGQFRISAPKIPAAPRHEIVSGFKSRIKDFEQSNIAVAFPSIPFNDKLAMTQAVLNMILGGSMSSRLFQHIREQLGLAYSVYTAQTTFAQNGSFSIYLNISAQNTERVMRAVREEIEKIRKDGVFSEEFERAKAQLKSACVFAQESSQTIMNSAGKLLLMTDEIYNIDKKIEEIEAVTVEGVNAFLRNLLKTDRVCAAYVGKKTTADILGILKN